MSQTLIQLISTYGYVIVFTIVMLESLGLPLPGETTLLTAAAFAATGRLLLAGVIIAAAAGAIVGDAAGYWIGRTGGLALINRYGRWLHVDASKLARAQQFFEHHGAKTVFLGRFVALLRMLAAVLAGVARMPYARFTFFNVLGGICWAGLFGTLGYVFGRNLPALERAVGRAGWLVALLIALVVGLALGVRWVNGRRDDLWDWANKQWQRVVSLPMLRTLQKWYPAAWSFASRRLSPGGYLGLHLTVGMLLSLLALLSFAGIAEDVVEHEDLTQFDLTLADAFHRRATPIGIAVFRAITMLGSVSFMTALMLGVGVVLLLRKNWLFLAGWLIAEVGGALLTAILKMLFQRPRPQFAIPFVTETSWSFPSGHAMGSLIGYGMLAYLLWLATNGRWTRVLLAGTLATLILLIGFSRLYLGAHYFSDVVAGYAAGLIWLATCVTGLEVVRRRPPVQHSPGVFLRQGTGHSQ